MAKRYVFISTLWWVLAITVTLAVSSSVPTSNSSPPTRVAISVITPVPNQALIYDLRKRQDSSKWICGYQANGAPYSACAEGEWCAGTALSNGKGYQYCSTYQLVDQAVPTTGIANWDIGQYCPRSAVCCPAGGELNHVATAIFGVVGYDYMITGYFCAPEPNQTSTYHAVRKVLNPTSISKALASLASLATETSTKPALPMGAQVGIGVGIGIGAPIVVLVIALFIWHRRNNRRRPKKKSISQPGSPVEPRNPHADYSWFKDQSKSDGGAAELHSNKTEEPQELHSSSQSPELPSVRSPTRTN